MQYVAFDWQSTSLPRRRCTREAQRNSHPARRYSHHLDRAALLPQRRHHNLLNRRHERRQHSLSSMGRALSRRPLTVRAPRTVARLQTPTARCARRPCTTLKASRTNTLILSVVKDVYENSQQATSRKARALLDRHDPVWTRIWLGLAGRKVDAPWSSKRSCSMTYVPFFPDTPCSFRWVTFVFGRVEVPGQAGCSEAILDGYYPTLDDS